MLLSAHVTSSFFSIWFNNFALTTGFYWSYTLFLKSLVLMRSYTHILYAIPNGNVLCNTDNKASTFGMSVNGSVVRIKLSPLLAAWKTRTPRLSK